MSRGPLQGNCNNNNNNNMQIVLGTVANTVYECIFFLLKTILHGNT